MPIAIRGPLAHRLDAPLRALVRSVIAQEGRKLGEIAVVLTDDDELRALNRRWRGIDRATDVISFAYDEHEPDAETRPVNGDLVVSMDRVRDQAKRWRVSDGAELARLVVHGALHLCGHDHAKADERRLMRGREERSLRAVRAMVAKLDAALVRAASAAAKPASARPKPRRRVAASRATGRRPARAKTAAGRTRSRRTALATKRARRTTRARRGGA